MPEQAVAIKGTEMKSFDYKGMTFKPLRKLGSDFDFFRISQKLVDRKITPERWNYDSFYQAADQAGVGEFDIFECNGITVIPGLNYLFEYKE